MRVEISSIKDSENHLQRRAALGFLLSLIPVHAFAQIALPGAVTDALKGNASNGGRTGLLGAGLGQPEISAGLKDMLKVASRNVVGKVGKPGGYYGDPSIRIPLPSVLQQVQQPLATVGASGMLDDLSLRMNRGAEQAAPKALGILTNAATNISFDDARQILTGPQDSVTQYFKRTSSDQMVSAFTPIMGSALKGSGAMRVMNSVKDRVQGIPMIGMLGQLGGQQGGMLQSLANFDLVGFATNGALSGIFHYLGAQEANIRSNPAARTTDLLRKVFG